VALIAMKFFQKCAGGHSPPADTTGLLVGDADELFTGGRLRAHQTLAHASEISLALTVAIPLALLV